jgi:hypothetical protein
MKLFMLHHSPATNIRPLLTHSRLLTSEAYAVTMYRIHYWVPSYFHHYISQCIITSHTIHTENICIPFKKILKLIFRNVQRMRILPIFKFEGEILPRK